MRSIGLRLGRYVRSLMLDNCAFQCVHGVMGCLGLSGGYTQVSLDNGQNHVLHWFSLVEFASFTVSWRHLFPLGSYQFLSVLNIYDVSCGVGSDVLVKKT